MNFHLEPPRHSLYRKYIFEKTITAKLRIHAQNVTLFMSGRFGFSET